MKRLLAAIFLLVSISSYGQVAFFHAQNKVSGSTPPPPVGDTSAFITAQVLGTLRNNFSGNVGFKVLIGATDIQVTSLGRWVVSGNSQSHDVYLFDGSSTLLTSATVNTSGKTPGDYSYATITPYTLSAGTTYFVMSQEFNGGDEWYDANTTATTTAVGTIQSARNSFGDFGSGSITYTPVNFEYTTDTVDAAQAYFNRVTAAGGTLSGTEMSAWTTFVSAAKAHGYWDNIFGIYPFRGSSANSTKVNARSGAYEITWGGSPSYSSNGVAGNGTDAFGNTAFTPSSVDGALGLSMGVYVTVVGTSARDNNIEVGSGNSGSGGGIVVIQSRMTDGTARGLIYKDFGFVGETDLLKAAVSTPAGFTAISRLSSTSSYLQKNGATIATDTRAMSIPAPAKPLYVLGLRYDDASGPFTDNTIGLMYFGKGFTEAQLTAIAADVNAFMTTLSINVY